MYHYTPKDKEVVVIHDETLERLRNSSGWVKGFTLQEFRKFNYNKSFPKYGEVTIPTLEEGYDY